MAQPEKRFRIGSCVASVFVNQPESKDGGEARPFRTVSLQRRYKDGDEWKTSTNFSLAHVPHAIAVLQLAMTHVATQEADSDDNS